MKKVLLIMIAALATACSEGEFFGFEMALKAKYGMTFDCYDDLTPEFPGVDMKVIACVGEDNIIRNVYIIDGEVTL